MKFNCPKVSRYDKNLKDAQSLRQWHTIFAFLPHRTPEGICVWLELVERRYPHAWVGSVYHRLYLETPEFRVVREIIHEQS